MRCLSVLNRVLLGSNFSFKFIAFQSYSNFVKPKMSSTDAVTTGLDETQVKLLEEECILVDEADKPIGCASKKDCHLWTNIEKGMLHRAFSVFLFNSQGHLLLQQRSDAKITFPALWTNTCCSHPLNLAEERDETLAMGVKVAARRKLEHELGIPQHLVTLEDFHYLTRMHYKSRNADGDERWGEHEIDYILFIQKDVPLNINPNEVKAVKYVTPTELLQHLNTAGVKITPWFKLAVDKFLTNWWTQLNDLSPLYDHSTIHRLC